MFDYYVEIKDSNGATVDKLYRGGGLLLDFSWGYSRIGGCAEFSMSTGHTLFNPPRYSGFYSVSFYMYDDAIADYTLWYKGRILQISPKVGGFEHTEISGYGYSSVLKTLIATSETYTTQEVSVIVKNLLDTYVTPYSDITYDAGDIEATSVTVDSLVFNNTDIQECMSTLGDIVGAYEWGVDRNAKFFFKARSETPRIYAMLGVNIASFDLLTDYNQLVNRVYVEGGLVGGVKYKRTVDNAESQARWGLIAKIMQNTAITTDTVADFYGNAVLAEQSQPQQRATLTMSPLLGFSAPVEATVPLGTAHFKQAAAMYGQRKYGNGGMYGGEFSMMINSVRYSLIDAGIKASFNLGRDAPELSTLFKRLEYNISQERQRE